MKGDLIELEIESLAFGGDGVSRYGGKVYFVAGALVGDKVSARVILEKKNYGKAEVARLITPSVFRRDSACPLVHDCGGCPWMELELQTQVNAKRQFVSDALNRIGKINLEVSPVKQVGGELAYRSRVRLRAIHNDEGRLVLGFNRRQSRDIAPVANCPVANQQVNALMPEVVAAVTELELAENVEEVSLSAIDPSKKGTVSLKTDRAIETDVAKKLLDLIPSAAGLSIRSADKDWTSDVGDLKQSIDTPACGVMTFHPAGFSQVNLLAHNALIEEVLTLANGSGSVLDLFCGFGSYSVALAKKGAKVVGVDINHQSIADAKKNGEGLSARFIQGSAIDEVWRMIDEEEIFDTVIVNPPRTGAGELMEHLPPLVRKSIIYVSCSPPDLARDAKLLADGGFTLTKAQPYDLFPQTTHVETVALFQR